MEIQSEGQDLHLIKVVQRLTGSKCFFVIIVYQGHSRRLYEYFLCSVKKTSTQYFDDERVNVDQFLQRII